jgi:CheY-like chemotaxis protein
LRLLLADDHAALRAAIGALIGSLGHEVDLVGDGRAAMEAVGHRDYDAVLMDVEMPVMDGLEATRCLRCAESRGANRLLIIGLSADDSRENRASCLAAGMDTLLRKPVLQRDLVAALER